MILRSLILRKSSVLRNICIRYISNVSVGQEKIASWFYLQNSIEDAANRKSVGFSPNDLLASTTGEYKEILIKNAQFLQSELPVRVANRVLGFRYLPFIIASNPSLLRVQDLYINSFHLLENCPPVTDSETEEVFRQSLVNLLDDHKNVISLLSQGFKECRNHMPDESFASKFLDDLLKARLGMRLLCDHHIMLAEPRENYLGSFHLKFSPHELVKRKIKEVQKQCDMKYGSAPDVKIKGDVKSSFVYIPPPLEYILSEVLKNAMRAVIEAKEGGYIDDLEPIVVTIVNNESYFILRYLYQNELFRVEDGGAGISGPELNKIWNYGYTGVTRRLQNLGVENGEGGLLNGNNYNIFGAITENRMAGTLYGYGFGLPVCRAYASYLGGGVKLETMLGLGTSVYITLRHFTQSGDDFKF